MSENRQIYNKKQNLGETEEAERRRLITEVYSLALPCDIRDIVRVRSFADLSDEVKSGHLGERLHWISTWSDEFDFLRERKCYPLGFWSIDMLVNFLENKNVDEWKEQLFRTRYWMHQAREELNLRCVRQRPFVPQALPDASIEDIKLEVRRECKLTLPDPVPIREDMELYQAYAKDLSEVSSLNDVKYSRLLSRVVPTGFELQKYKPEEGFLRRAHPIDWRLIAFKGAINSTELRRPGSSAAKGTAYLLEIVDKISRPLLPWVSLWYSMFVSTMPEEAYAKWELFGTFSEHIAFGQDGHTAYAFYNNKTVTWSMFVPMMIYLGKISGVRLGALSCPGCSALVYLDPTPELVKLTPEERAKDTERKFGVLQGYLRASKPGSEMVVPVTFADMIGERVRRDESLKQFLGFKSDPLPPVKTEMGTEIVVLRDPRKVVHCMSKLLIEKDSEVLEKNAELGLALDRPGFTMRFPVPEKKLPMEKGVPKDWKSLHAYLVSDFIEVAEWHSTKTASLYTPYAEGHVALLVEIMMCFERKGYPTDIVGPFWTMYKGVVGHEQRICYPKKKVTVGEHPRLSVLELKKMDSQWTDMAPSSLGSTVRMFSNSAEVVGSFAGCRVLYFALNYDSAKLKVRLSGSFPAIGPTFSPMDEIPIQKARGIGSQPEKLRVPVSEEGIAVYRVPNIKLNYARPIWFTFYEEDTLIASRPFWLHLPQQPPEFHQTGPLVYSHCVEGLNLIAEVCLLEKREEGPKRKHKGDKRSTKRQKKE